MTPEGSELLRKPFPAEQIGKLPRVTCRDCSDRSKTCEKHKKAKCSVCGASVSTQHIHLDYVGHAAVTDRLLSVDPEWSWEPFGLGTDGLPALTVSGGETSLWIKLTILGVTRPGVGTAASGSFELPKQLISDAIRNGAMRFGVALDLWSKEDLGHDESRPPVDLITPSFAAHLRETFAAIADDDERKRLKALFVGKFGPPSEMLFTAEGTAFRWLRDNVPDATRPFDDPPQNTSLPLETAPL